MGRPRWRADREWRRPITPDLVASARDTESRGLTTIPPAAKLDAEAGARLVAALHRLVQSDAAVGTDAPATGLHPTLTTLQFQLDGAEHRYVRNGSEDFPHEQEEPFWDARDAVEAVRVAIGAG